MGKFLKSLGGVLLKAALAAAVLLGVGLVFLDARITATFADKRFELPARVYARPLELYEGRPLTGDELRYELKLLGYKQVTALRNPGEVLRQGNRYDIYVRGFQFYDDVEPARRIRLTINNGAVSALSSKGQTVELMRLDPAQIGGIYPSHGEDRLLVRLSDVPETVRQGLLAVEDRNFERHWGFSITGMVRAAIANLRSGQVVAGGSTITQQLVKNYYLTAERSYTRKFKELLMALLLEFHYSKEEILESYVNEVYLGQEGHRAIHGLALGAQHYFDTPLEQLGLHQQALLIGLIKGPSLYNPKRNPKRALQRRNVVLNVMSETGVISPEQAAVAKAMPLQLNGRKTIHHSFPAFLDLVRRQLRRDYREQDLTSRGLSVFTSFDPLLQRTAERAMVNVLDRIDKSDAMQGAMIVTKVDTGEVAALVGGRDVRYAGFNRALDAKRPAGSLLKPAVYLTALEQPENYTLATLLNDSAFSISGQNGEVWTPRNFDRQEHGEVMLFEALSNSYNLATARLALDLGLHNVVDMLERLGIEQPLEPLPSLSLGAGSFSPLDVAALYQTIASGGYRTPLRAIRDIVDSQGEPLKRYALNYERSVSLQAMHLLHFAMRDVVRNGTGRAVYGVLPADFQVAGKTGTTNDGRDSWFAGFSGDLLAVSWLGRDDNAATSLTGSTGALKVWADFMAAASKRSLAYRMPEGIVTATIDTQSGARSGASCPDTRLIPFIDGSVPMAETECLLSEQRKATVGDWLRGLLGR
ncbi:MAG: penicillin-binding protein 1B [Gammaproteobacteria bacterium]|nr:MAG: penicillin-binding protein 1B [Gammaproteobacteria bacterium]